MKVKTGVKNRRLMVAKNSIMMLVVLVVIFLAVFAWYFVQKDVTADGITVSAALPDEVEIAKASADGVIVDANSSGDIDDGDWSESITFDGPYTFSNDVTSDGINFIIPAFNTTENNDTAKELARVSGKIVNTNGLPKYNTTNTTQVFNTQNATDENPADYYRTTFLLRSKQKNITVKPTAYLAAKVEVDGQGWDMSGLTDAQKQDRRVSSYGNFSSDALVAAMRVSLTGAPVLDITNDTYVSTKNGTTVNDSCKFLWVPRPDLYLNVHQDPDNTTDWTLTPNVSDESGGTNYDKSAFTYKHDYYEIKDENNPESGVHLVEDYEDAFISDFSQQFSVHQNCSVPTLGVTCGLTEDFKDTNDIDYEPQKQEDDYYYYRFNLNVWIEGTDSEARRAMDTGKFSLFLEFGN